ncbi:hypothetical protein SAM40697_5205 [Streptomyces ambofaciens]|uniref:Uncharacterized protein n=1 Tax=Streptomyces ambofaciens TaxID=1889 RepID=A0ABM6B5U0_STRAM|nr:hypothetical protein SAM40697_5205 [Streptomyces ambofaciens]
MSPSSSCWHSPSRNACARWSGVTSADFSTASGTSNLPMRSAPMALMCTCGRRLAPLSTGSSPTPTDVTVQMMSDAASSSASSTTRTSMSRKSTRSAKEAAWAGSMSYTDRGGQDSVAHRQQTARHVVVAREGSDGGGQLERAGVGRRVGHRLDRYGTSRIMVRHPLDDGCVVRAAQKTVPGGADAFVRSGERLLESDDHPVREARLGN